MLVRAAVGGYREGGEWLGSQRPRAAPGPAAGGRIPSPRLVSSLSASPLRDGSGHEVPATGGVRGGACPCGGRLCLLVELSVILLLVAR